jgi:hypothetical protein
MRHALWPEDLARATMNHFEGSSLSVDSTPYPLVSDRIRERASICLHRILFVFVLKTNRSPDDVSTIKVLSERPCRSHRAAVNSVKLTAIGSSGPGAAGEQQAPICEDEGSNGCRRIWAIGFCQTAGRPSPAHPLVPVQFGPTVSLSHPSISSNQGAVHGGQQVNPSAQWQGTFHDPRWSKRAYLKTLVSRDTRTPGFGHVRMGIAIAT